MALTLHLLRHGVHGHPAEVLAGRMAGVSLGYEGKQQAARLAHRFPPHSLDALVTSPLQRCRETAAYIEEACGLTATVDPDAAEVDFGEWTGQRFSALEADPRWRNWNLHRDEAQAPGGEPMERVRSRVLAMLDGMRTLHSAGRVAVVTHAEIVRTAVLHILGLPLQAYDRLEVAPASITTLCLWPGGGRLLGLNDVSSHHPALVPAREALAV
ncbi:MAG: phosphoglycerate mutase family protein [Rubritepida sp.]|nr:phosphoglycerate mutase family protein [Rubritepida sp.]